MGLQRVGHVVLKMRDLDKAKHFYRDILGMAITDEREGFGVFFRFSDYHHDLAVFKVSDKAAAPEADQVGLSHLAIVADDWETVRAYHAKFVENDIEIVRTVDHGVTRSVYAKDPEGNEVEIYCEVPEVRWQEVDTIILADPIPMGAAD